jgi:hypothetical protein
MRLAVVAALLVVGCGDDQEPPVREDARRIADAALDAPPDAPGLPAACKYPSDCTSNICCVIISPGGAHYSMCNSGCGTYPRTCQPGQPCEDTTKTCQLTQLTISPNSEYWVCK